MRRVYRHIINALRISLHVSNTADEAGNKVQECECLQNQKIVLSSPLTSPQSQPPQLQPPPCRQQCTASSNHSNV